MEVTLHLNTRCFDNAMADLLQGQYHINNFWLRLRSRDSVKKIGYFFGVSRETAKRTKFRVQGYMLYKNPTASLPSHTNHKGISQEQVGWGYVVFS